MNAYPTCADWTDLDKEVERVSREFMEDIDRMIYLKRKVDKLIAAMQRNDAWFQIECSKPEEVIVKFCDTYYLENISTAQKEYDHLKTQNDYPLYNLASYRLQNYYQNHHVDPSIL